MGTCIPVLGPLRTQPIVTLAHGTIREVTRAGAVRPGHSWSGSEPLRPTRGSRRRGGAPGSSVGEPATRNPAASSAATFDAAVPRAARDDRAGVAHPLALGRRPAGDERDLRDVGEVLGRPGRGLLLGRAADLADQHDRLGLGVRGEQLEDVEERRADDRVAADADAGRLAEAGVGHRLDGLVGQRAGAADDPDPALAMDRARDDPDLGPTRRRRAGAVRADQPGAGARGRPRRPGPCRAPGCPR